MLSRLTGFFKCAVSRIRFSHDFSYSRYDMRAQAALRSDPTLTLNGHIVRLYLEDIGYNADWFKSDIRQSGIFPAKSTINPLESAQVIHAVTFLIRNDTAFFSASPRRLKENFLGSTKPNQDQQAVKNIVDFIRQSSYYQEMRKKYFEKESPAGPETSH